MQDLATINLHLNWHASMELTQGFLSGSVMTRVPLLSPAEILQVACKPKLSSGAKLNRTEIFTT